MAVQYVPGFWESLGEGISGAAQNWMALQDLKQRKAAEARAQQLFEAQIAPFRMQQDILQSEANPVQGFIPALLGTPTTPITLPSKRFTPNQYQVAGLKSPQERLRESERQILETRESDLRVQNQENQIPVGQLNARRATAALSGVDSEIARQRVTEITPIIDDFAKSYVAEQLLKRGGKITKANVAALANDAFASFISDPTRGEKLGTSGLDMQTLRPIFDRAVKAAWDEQTALDNDSLRARTYGTSTADRRPQLMNALTNIAKVYENRVKAFTEDPMNMGRYEAQTNPNSPAAQEYLRKVQEMQSTVNLLTAASAQVGGGMMSEEQAQQLLNAATNRMTAETQVQVTPGQAQAIPDDALLAEASKYAPSQWKTWLDKGVALGKITPDQAKRVLAQLERRPRE